MLYPFVEKGIPIIGLEPSCLLTFNDEYLDLLPDDPRVKQIAAKTMLIEEFLAGAAERNELKIKWKDEKRKVLVHGHCYQKAITGTAALRKMLSLPGWEVSEINSGCCGMAGSFGYEAEHFDLSMKIGGERLFPAVKNAEANTYVVASGMSCRHQIEHGTKRKPLHPIELLAEGRIEARWKSTIRIEKQQMPQTYRHFRFTKAKAKRRRGCRFIVGRESENH